MIDPKFKGKKYGPTKYVVGLEKIKEFAHSTGDENPLYHNEAAAAAGPHGGIVAPPMFAVVYFKELIAKALFDPEVSLNMAMLVHGEQEFEFHAVARPDDVVLCEGEIADITAKETLDVITLRVKSTVEGRPLATGLYTFVVRR